jgi:hypothetical protein
MRCSGGVTSVEPFAVLPSLINLLLQTDGSLPMLETPESGSMTYS